MAILSVSSAITAGFIQKLSSSDGSGKSGSAGLSGQDAVKTTLSGLQRGVKVFSKSVSGLNNVLSYLNITKDNLKKLSTITDDMIVVAQQATQSGIGSFQRDELSEGFAELVGKFQKVLSQASNRDYDTLQEADLEKIFTVLGFDRQKSSSFLQMLRRFDSVENSDGKLSLASDKSQAERPVPIPAAAYTGIAPTSRDFDFLFDEERDISSRPNAYRMLADLAALKDQLETNMKAVDESFTFVVDNIYMIRSVGLAFLGAADDFTRRAPIDVNSITEAVRDKMRSMPREQLRELENLDGLTTAALTTNSSETKLSTTA